MPRKTNPPCPDCRAVLRRKVLADSDDRIWSKWRYCQECGWDERGKFEVTVWNHEGDVVKCARAINQSEVEELQDQYGCDPHYVVQVEEVYQAELA